MDLCRINHWHVYPIPTCSILFYVIQGCSICAYSALYMSTVVYMCLEWPWENGVFFRDSAGIRRVLYRTLFGCCSDLPGECSGVLRRNAKKVRTKSVIIPAQDRIDIGFQLQGVQEKFLRLPLLNRLINRNTPEGNTVFEYYNTPNNQALKKVYNSNYSQELVYDNYRRLVTKMETITK